MRKDIILSGVGGQGILTIATIIGEAATAEGINLKQAEVHGMSQRGGDVQSNLRLSDETIYSDLIAQGEADLIISMEPMEALRYLPYLHAESVFGSEVENGQRRAQADGKPLHPYFHLLRDMAGEVEASGIGDGFHIVFQERLDAGQEGGFQSHAAAFRGRIFPDKNGGRSCDGVGGP